MRPPKETGPTHKQGKRSIDLALQNPDLWWYRERAIGMLKRYFRLAVETGRLPSVLGRECFRARVTSPKGYTFENAVIFVHDVEHCLEELDGFSRELLGWHVLQEFSLRETAHLMGCGQSTAYRGFLDALDRLTEIMMSHKLMACAEVGEEVEKQNAPACAG